MDNSFNNTDDEFIRPPDETFREQLIQDDRCKFDKEMDEALQLSLEEFSQQQKVFNSYEENLINEHISETKRRREIFKDFLFNIYKVSKIDKEVREIYDILDPIIDAYCGQYIETCELDEQTYDKIFNILKNIRNNKQTLEVLKTIILRE
jgi:hypothetical protein